MTPSNYLPIKTKSHWQVRFLFFFSELFLFNRSIFEIELLGNDRKCSVNIEPGLRLGSTWRYSRGKFLFSFLILRMIDNGFFFLSMNVTNHRNYFFHTHVYHKKMKRFFDLKVLTSDHYVHIDLFAIAIWWKVDRCCLSSNDKQNG